MFPLQMFEVTLFKRVWEVSKHSLDFSENWNSLTLSKNRFMYLDWLFSMGYICSCIVVKLRRILALWTRQKIERPVVVGKEMILS